MSAETFNPFQAGEDRSVQTIVDAVERGVVLEFPEEHLMPLLVAASRLPRAQSWAVTVADGIARVELPR